MMDPKPRLFIFERKEVTVLFLLAVFVAIFAFTLGVHFGKQLTPEEAQAPVEAALDDTSEPTSVGEGTEKLPEKEALSEAAKNAPAAGDDSVAKALQDEVAKTGIKLDKPIQTDLPTEVPSSNEEDKSARAESGGRPDGKFTLQVAAFPSESEAKRRLREILKREESGFIGKAEVKNKTWYRVYVGGFLSKVEAERQGSRLVSRKVIDGFVVSKMP